MRKDCTSCVSTDTHVVCKGENGKIDLETSILIFENKLS